MLQLFFIAQLYKSSNHRLRNEFISPKDRFGLHLTRLIMKNMTDRQFGTEELANEVHLSLSQLNRKLKASGLPPAATFIREIRLRFAAHLLLHESFSIGTVAYQAGFSSQAHFCRCFKQFFDLSPKNYLKRAKSPELE